MTKYYNRQTINNSHLVYFSKPKNNELYYYNFDTKSWAKVIPLDSLPYGLCSYRIEGKDDTQVIVTCQDSYRLASEIPENTDHEEMLQQKQWRNELVCNGKEFDFLTSKNEWQKGVVCWVKSDIIPGVLNIGNKNFHNIPFCTDINGYYYKESKKIAKSCTHSQIITQKQLIEDKKHKDNIKQQINDEDNLIIELKQNLKMYVPTQFKTHAYNSSCGRTGFIDTISYYNSLKKCPFEITKKVIVEFIEEDKKEEYFNKKNNIENIGLLAFISEKFKNKYSKYDVVYDSYQVEPKESATDNYLFPKYINLDKGDAFFDIQVHNASFAHLVVKLYRNDYTKIKMTLNENNIFTFTDFTYCNPLFKASSGNIITIVTDGDKATYKNIWIDIKEVVVFFVA